MYNVYHPWHARLLLLLARLSVGMTDDDARKLEAALTPLIHTAQEQVVVIILMMDSGYPAKKTPLSTIVVLRQ